MMRQSYPSIERYPTQHLRRYEVFARVSNIPHPCIRLVPGLAQPTQEASQNLPDFVIQGSTIFIVQVDRVKDGDVENEL